MVLHRVGTLLYVGTRRGESSRGQAVIRCSTEHTFAAHCDLTLSPTKLKHISYYNLVAVSVTFLF